MRPAELHEVSRSRFDIYICLIFLLVLVHNRERNPAELNAWNILYALLPVGWKNL